MAHKNVHIILAVLHSLLPRYMRKGGLQPRKKLHPTSYLDALRGIAAICVVTYHRFAYSDTWIMQQPFFRVLMTGKAMVNVFFVISGYVLSYKMLKHIQNKETELLLDSLASSNFRRFIRLYGSCAVATFLSMLLARFNWSDPTLVHKDTFFEQLYDWAYDLLELSNPFGSVTGWWFVRVANSRYVNDLWTIPVEYRGSMMTFTFCAATCKLKTLHRMILCWVIILICYWWRALYAALFLEGLFLADLSLHRQKERNRLAAELPQSVTDSSLKTPRGQHNLLRIAYSICLIFALFLLGQPSEKMDLGPWPWPTMYNLIPLHYHGTGALEYFWLSIGAFVLVWALESCPVLQTPLTWNFPQYLGELSFGIYVLHMLFIWSLYSRVLIPLTTLYLGKSRLAYLPATIIHYMVILWAAELFTKVDTKIVGFSRWLQTKSFSH